MTTISLGRLSCLVSAISIAACSTNHQSPRPTDGVCIEEPVQVECPAAAEREPSARREAKAKQTLPKPGTRSRDPEIQPPSALSAAVERRAAERRAAGVAQ